MSVDIRNLHCLGQARVQKVNGLCRDVPCEWTAAPGIDTCKEHFQISPPHGVSRLVIFHEEVQDGNAMPDLSRPVEAVSRAVINLARVGRDTINTSQDPILRHEMPSALHQVERAARLLEEASKSLREDPFSQNACSKLIEGSRGILQGTSAILLSFDDSEVRKIIKGCYKILEYINIAEVIETMEDLIKFVKDLSPSLTQLSRDIDNREKELTHQIHREMLVRVMESIKNLTPILICAMKAVIHIIANGGPAMQEVVENRSFLIHSLTEDITELVRILQLTTYDEDEWDADFMSILKKLESGIGSRLKHAHDWLEDPTSVTGGFGERAVRQILECGHRVAGHCLAADRQAIEKMCGDLASMTDALCELRQDNKLKLWLMELTKISEGIVNLKQSGYQQPAHTLLGRMEQAMAWLSNPTPDNTHLGQVAISLIVDEAQKLGQVSPDYQEKINEYCSQIDYATSKMLDLCKTGKGSSLEAKENAFALKPLLEGLKAEMQKALYQRVVKDFLDISPAIKQFTEVVTKPQ
ncbi:VCL, partial [Cordylochernes scorpioides]